MTARFPRPASEASLYLWASGDDAAPIVFVHGFSGCPASFDAVVDALPPPHDRILAALPLFGHDGEPGSHRGVAGSDGFTAEVNRVAAALRALSRRPAHLVGYSMGARVALGVVLNHPTVVERATLIGVHPGLANARERANRLGADQRWIDLLERDGIEAFVRAWETLPLWDTQQRLPGDVLDRQRAQRLAHSPAGLAAAMAALGLASMPDLGPALARIHVPVQLVAGEHDAKFRSIAARMWNPIREARLAIVPNAGHNPVLEAPRALALLIDEHDRRARAQSAQGATP